MTKLFFFTLKDTMVSLIYEYTYPSNVSRKLLVIEQKWPKYMGEEIPIRFTIKLVYFTVCIKTQSVKYSWQ